MSALFNQTNLTPGTSFSGTGSGDTFPTGLTIGTGNGGAITPYTSGGGSGLQLNPAAGGQGVVITAGGSPFDNLNLTSKTINWQNINTGTMNSWATFSFTDANSKLQNLSSIQSVGGSNINMTALVSTLATAFPGCVS
jgi:hypothetical protein